MSINIKCLLQDNPLVQAPLAGYSCAPFRLLAHEYGAPAFTCTEMLSAKHIYSGAPQAPRYTVKDPGEGLVCWQLSGDTPEALVAGARAAVSWGADMVDLNCGCPMPKIRKKQCGSRLLSDSRQLCAIVKAMKTAVDVPVLVKIRVDSDSGEQFNQDVAGAVEEAGADALTIHGRHWSERYNVPVRLDEIKAIARAVSCPVIGNGDVSDAASAKRMLEDCGCDGVMIARASVGQPWLFASIRAELKGDVFIAPSIDDIGDIFLRHIKGLMVLEDEKRALLQSRKLGKYYARDNVPPDFLKALYACERFLDLECIVRRWFRA